MTARQVPGFLRPWVLHFETAIERAARRFADGLAPGSRVLDAGAGELQYAGLFARHRYVAVDLAIGDAAWDYRRLHCVADLESLPLASGCCDACINIVTLEHVREPAAVMAELARVLRPGGRLLLVVPHEWEVHQSPHDYFRFTRHGVRHLLERSGLRAESIVAVGGFFRLLSRRMLNSLQFFRGIWVFPAALVFAPPALLLPLLDGLDRERNFTLGYVCVAVKPVSGG
jgi:SAM-dependent methyltransferase